VGQDSAMSPNGSAAQPQMAHLFAANFTGEASAPSSRRLRPKRFQPEDMPDTDLMWNPEEPLSFWPFILSVFEVRRCGYPDVNHFTVTLEPLHHTQPVGLPEFEPKWEPQEEPLGEHRKIFWHTIHAVQLRSSCTTQTQRLTTQLLCRNLLPFCCGGYTNGGLSIGCYTNWLSLAQDPNGLCKADVLCIQRSLLYLFAPNWTTMWS